MPWTVNRESGAGEITASLEKVRNAIDAALESGFGDVETFVADGEGYRLHVVAHDAERMKQLKLPYMTFDHPDIKGRYPSSLVPVARRYPIRTESRPGDGGVLSDEEWFAFQRKLGLDFAPGGGDGDGGDGGDGKDKA